MSDAQVRNLERDGEHRSFAAHGTAVVGSAGGLSLMRGVFEPGWRWSADVAPLAGTASCGVRHLGYVVSGTMAVRADDGAEVTIAAGDLFDLPPGHDAWVVGDEPCVLVDVSPEATRYASGSAGPIVEDDNSALVRRGYAAFNRGDVETLRTLMSHDVVQHVPGTGPLSGAYKGIDAVLGLYGRMAELTGGTLRAHLLEVHSDGATHALAVHQSFATRDGMTRISRGSILFTILGGRATDLLELSSDVAGDSAFLA